jgi:hypothetical protein
MCGKALAYRASLPDLLRARLCLALIVAIEAQPRLFFNTRPESWRLSAHRAAKPREIVSVSALLCAPRIFVVYFFRNSNQRRLEPAK